MNIRQEILRLFKHDVFKQSFTYTASNSIKNAIPFLLLPILTRYLTPGDYGIVGTFEIILGMAVVLVGLNLRGAIWVNYFSLPQQELKVYIGNVILLQLSSFTVTIIVILLCKTYIASLIAFPEEWIPIVILVALSQSFIMIILALWQVEKKALQYGSFQILHMACNVGLSLLLIVVLGQNWQGRLLGVAVASLSFAVLGIFIIYKKRLIRLLFNKNYIKDSLMFGMPLLPHSLSGLIVTGIDRFFLNSMVSVATTGIYVVGYQVGMIIGLIARSFNQAWSVFLFEKLKGDKYTDKIKIVKFTYIFFIIILIFALLLSLVASPFLKFFVGDEFQGANVYVWWIAFGYAAEGMYYMVVNYIFYVKKTYILSLVSIMVAIINIVLNYYLIKLNGGLGAAQATAISLLTGFVLTWFLSAKVYKMPWSAGLKISRSLTM
jgi:O-antigen/teichoic acid export membrane protein